MDVRGRGLRVRLFAAVIVGVPLVLAGGTTASGHGVPDKVGDNLAAAAKNVTAGPARTQAMVTENFTVVGHSDLGGGGLNADVWSHRGFAYVGVWSGTCPATGVKVADVRTPNAPRLVARLQNPRGTSAEDVVVRRVNTATFTGDLAVVGIQTCDDPTTSTAFRGLQFWDVTNPRQPRRLSRWRSPFGGCHEVDLVARSDGKVLAGCAEPFAEQAVGADEVTVVDVTRPASPRRVASFGLLDDAGIDPATTAQNVGCFPASFAHSVRFANRGRTLFASYWDVGTFRFDVDAGGRLHRVNRTDIAPPDEDGDNHSMTLGRGGEVAIINSEDFSPEDPTCADFNGWGEAFVYTNTRGRPEHLATFSTPNTRSIRTDGFFSVHNTEVGGGGVEAFSSWYSDGVVWWSLDDPVNPAMRGQFVPPPTEDPTGVFPPVPLVWGVFLDRGRDLVLASDINSGLWVLRPTGLANL